MSERVLIAVAVVALSQTSSPQTVATSRPVPQNPLNTSLYSNVVRKKLFVILLMGVVLAGDGFASSQWLKEDPLLVLRLHRRDGSVQKELKIAVVAAYGLPRIFGSIVTMAVSSGDALPESTPVDSTIYQTNTADLIRLDLKNDGMTHLPQEQLVYLPDQILEWDTASGDVKRTRIPHDDGELMERSTSHFLLSNQILLAGEVDEYRRPAMATFSTTPNVPNRRVFTVAGTAEVRFSMEIVFPGSDDPSDIIVNDAGGRAHKAHMIDHATGSSSAVVIDPDR
ncbi:hypothetical protein C8J56DRAFT_1101371 [Mycena floridula]|nr:hypothetical protein C8J56DRAFT_1101371 [Mycena floridula]